MPELPEVETVARDLRALVVGATIVGAACDWPRTIQTHAPDAFAAAIAGRVIEAVGRRGKRIVVELSGDRALTVHLKMTGQLFVVPPEAPADAHVHLVLALDDGREVRFRDIRKFGRVGLYARSEVGDLETEDGGASPLAELGPEPLDPAFTLKAFRTRIRGRRGRLKSLLTDQAFVAGVGNIYADEALWRARLHPLRTAPTLRPDDERRLYGTVRGILEEAIERRGSSIDDYTAPEGDGSMQERLDVYQREGEPCPRCGRPIRRILLGMRATHFCSFCQRLPAVDRPGAARTLAAGRTRERALAQRATRTAAASSRRGPRWTEMAAEGSLGLTPAEAARAAERARAERTRKAAASRRAAARGSTGPGAPPDTPRG
ncbi:MAG: bifunctional DNA-formamidopyrimidine glycosylase/DNA-(apurinic or apyrimidinic site) lyase [Chloroflexi bacterium]|nr:bifunctional DNA-formamidopyrimidine glycosylase/DNA-(apurinic or apyrimidinic site) lyase [Chloroflexota bacterium]